MTLTVRSKMFISTSSFALLSIDSNIALESFGLTNFAAKVAPSPIIQASIEVIINTKKIFVNTFPTLLGCLILAIDVVIVKKINGTIITNIIFKNKSPKGLSTDAFSPKTNPTTAPITSAINRIIVCL